MLNNLLNLFISILRLTVQNEIFIIIFGIVVLSIVISCIFSIVRSRF